MKNSKFSRINVTFSDHRRGDAIQQLICLFSNNKNFWINCNLNVFYYKHIVKLDESNPKFILFVWQFIVSIFFCIRFFCIVCSAHFFFSPIQNVYVCTVHRTSKSHCVSCQLNSNLLFVRPKITCKLNMLSWIKIIIKFKSCENAPSFSNNTYFDILPFNQNISSQFENHEKHSNGTTVVVFSFSLIFYIRFQLFILCVCVCARVHICHIHSNDVEAHVINTQLLKIEISHHKISNQIL